ncbi:MAG: plasmid stabilization protein [Pseudomonadota bacterium]
MAMMTIRNLDDELKAKLRIRAATNGRSMEEEVREILRVALMNSASDKASVADAIRDRMEPLGGVVLEALPREPVRDPPDLD